MQPQCAVLTFNAKISVGHVVIHLFLTIKIFVSRMLQSLETVVYTLIFRVLDMNSAYKQLFK